MVIAKKKYMLAKVVDLMVERMLSNVKRIKVLKNKVKWMKIPMLLAKVMHDSNTDSEVSEPRTQKTKKRKERV